MNELVRKPDKKLIFTTVLSEEKRKEALKQQETLIKSKQVNDNERIYRLINESVELDVQILYINRW